MIEKASLGFQLYWAVLIKSLLLSMPAQRTPAFSELLEGFGVHSLFMNHSLPSGTIDLPSSHLVLSWNLSQT